MTWRQWIRTVEIVPALGSADLPALEAQVDALLRTGCRVFHLRSREDPGAALATARLIQPMLRRYGAILDVQLDSPASPLAFAEVAEAGGDSVTFPLETAGEIGAALDAARAAGLAAGVAYAPGTDPAEVVEQAAGADIVRCPGQASLRAVARRQAPCRLAAGGDRDPGRRRDHPRERPGAVRAGARSLVVGVAIFEREDLPRAYRRLVQALA